MNYHAARRRDQVGSTTLGMLLLGLTLALGLVASAFVVSRSLERIKLAGDKIMVKGYAEEKVVSDAGTWRGSVTVRASDLQAGYSELEKDTARVKQMLESAAGNGAAVSVAPVTTRTVYETGPGGVQTGRVTGYELERGFELTSSDIKLITRIAGEASSLISEGVNINSFPPQYFFGDLNAVKVRLIGAATRTHSCGRSSSRPTAASRSARCGRRRKACSRSRGRIPRIRPITAATTRARSRRS